MLQSKTRLYDLRTRDNPLSSPEVVTDMLKDFEHDVYGFLYGSATLSMVTPYLAIKLYVLPDILLETFYVTNPICDSVVSKRVYRKYPVSLSHIATLEDLVKLNC